LGSVGCPKVFGQTDRQYSLALQQRLCVNSQDNFLGSPQKAYKTYTKENFVICVMDRRTGFYYSSGER